MATQSKGTLDNIADSENDEEEEDYDLSLEQNETNGTNNDIQEVSIQFEHPSKTELRNNPSLQLHHVIIRLKLLNFL